MDQDFKVRENKVRRAAERRGLVVEKSRKRDPMALGYGCFRILDSAGKPMFGSKDDAPTATLAEVEKYLGL